MDVILKDVQMKGGSLVDAIPPRPSPFPLPPFLLFPQVFGGAYRETKFADLWTLGLEGPSPCWTRLTAGAAGIPTIPEERYCHTFVWYEVRQQPLANAWVDVMSLLI